MCILSFLWNYLEWFAFFIQAISWEYVAGADPDVLKIVNLSPQNYVLKFFLFSFIMICIAIVQYVIYLLNSWFYTVKY